MQPDVIALTRNRPVKRDTSIVATPLEAPLRTGPQAACPGSLGRSFVTSANQSGKARATARFFIAHVALPQLGGHREYIGASLDVVFAEIGQDLPEILTEGCAQYAHAARRRLVR